MHSKHTWHRTEEQRNNFYLLFCLFYSPVLWELSLICKGERKTDKKEGKRLQCLKAFKCLYSFSLEQDQNFSWSNLRPAIKDPSQNQKKPAPPHISLSATLLFIQHLGYWIFSANYWGIIKDLLLQKGHGSEDLAYCTAIGSTCRISLRSSQNDSYNVVFEELKRQPGWALSASYMKSSGRPAEIRSFSSWLITAFFRSWRLSPHTERSSPAPPPRQGFASDRATQGRHVPPPEPILCCCLDARRRTSHPRDLSENNEPT